MSRSVFGWDLPPGVTHRMIDQAAGGDEPETKDQVSEDWREFTKEHPEFKGLEMGEALLEAARLPVDIRDTALKEVKGFIARWDEAVDPN